MLTALYSLFHLLLTEIYKSDVSILILQRKFVSFSNLLCLNLSVPDP